MTEPLISDSVRAFLEEPRFAVMATINRSGTPQLTVMWYALRPDDDVVVLNTSRGLLKERNLRRDPRMSLCVEDGLRYVTLEGRAQLIEDRAQQQREVNELIAPRYIGRRLGARRWQVIKDGDRIGIWLQVERVRAYRV
ncbi:MAG: PPOX class F420-dependent oxidoreductase [Chloroflexota bacterium]|nr:PPOX class F420-dependent oxidoreductase [Chloroflexota bacterium]